MEEEIRLYHLPRNEKKRLVKGWHAQKALPDASVSVPSDEFTEADQIGRSGSLRVLFATPPGALGYESQRTGTWRGTNKIARISDQQLTRDPDILHNQQEIERVPKTVGQVKHAYRTRARKQEAREASNAIRKREKYLEIRRGPRWREREAEEKVKLIKPAMIEMQQEGKEEDVASPPEEDVSDELTLLNLSVDDVETNATYHNELLRQIRQQLSHGGEVLLQSDCDTVKNTIQSTRLMLQTLCTQSLAYCVRDQDVVPDNVSQQHPTTRLTLRLLPRHQLPLQ
ncbi:hypothetical protein V7S43_002039 [Phytophthora oleae]|uniref:Uncharacterized protein n=1 Tax=Phytophthora oleae TaxID=2107226 RepID=A0ABD3G299_9STRA